MTKRTLTTGLFALCSACATSPPATNPQQAVSLQQHVIGVHRGSINSPGGPSKRTVVSAKPSLATQADVLARTGSPELQIAAGCWLSAGRITRCDYMRTLPGSLEVRHESLRLLREYVVAPAWAAGMGETNYAVIDVRLAYEGTELGAAGGCIVPLICGIPTPPPPPPPKIHQRLRFSR